MCAASGRASSARYPSLAFATPDSDSKPRRSNDEQHFLVERPKLRKGIRARLANQWRQCGEYIERERANADHRFDGERCAAIRDAKQNESGWTGFGAKGEQSARVHDWNQRAPESETRQLRTQASAQKGKPEAVASFRRRSKAGGHRNVTAPRKAASNRVPLNRALRTASPLFRRVQNFPDLCGERTRTEGLLYIGRSRFQRSVLRYTATPG